MNSKKVALVTGGARGIGRAIALELIQNDFDIIIFDKFFPEDFNSFIESVKEYNAEIFYKSVDITDSKISDEAVDEAYIKFGRIDVLVNNAGITKDKLLMRMTEEDWDAVLNVNLKGAFVTTKAVTKYMIRQKFGKIVNVSSVVGVMGNAGQSNYSASKAGLIGFTKSIAKELAGRGITSNAIAPGYVETDMTDHLSEEQKNAFLQVIPLKRGCKPQEVAGLVAFLASDKANYITGQVIAIDGGMTM